MGTTRALFALLAAAILATPGSARPDEAPAMRVHLLGTGGPELTPDRQGYATLVELPGTRDPDALLLFDAGRGALQAIYEQRINPKRVTRIFLTHLHSDHIAGLPDLWMTPWFLLGRTSPIEVWGPPGTAAMIAGMRAMYGHDLEHRTNSFNPASAIEVSTHEIGPGEVYRHGDVRIIAFVVSHADGDPAYGYRVERHGRSVVLSGDTTSTPSLREQATGADLLVQNVIAFGPRLSVLPEMQGVLAKLTTPEQAADLLRTARPRLAIFSHIVKKELPGRKGDDSIIARVRAAGYRGPLVMGRDHMVVEVGDTIRLVRPRHGARLNELDSKWAEP
jgi:ribonuclease Z